MSSNSENPNEIIFYNNNLISDNLSKMNDKLVKIHNYLKEEEDNEFENFYNRINLYYSNIVAEMKLVCVENLKVYQIKEIETDNKLKEYEIDSKRFNEILEKQNSEIQSYKVMLKNLNEKVKKLEESIASKNDIIRKNQKYVLNLKEKNSKIEKDVIDLLMENMILKIEIRETCERKFNSQKTNRPNDKQDFKERYDNPTSANKNSLKNEKLSYTSMSSNLLKITNELKARNHPTNINLEDLRKHKSEILDNREEKENNLTKLPSQNHNNIKDINTNLFKDTNSNTLFHTDNFISNGLMINSASNKDSLIINECDSSTYVQNRLKINKDFNLAHQTQKHETHVEKLKNIKTIFESYQSNNNKIVDSKFFNYLSPKNLEHKNSPNKIKSAKKLFDIKEKDKDNSTQNINKSYMTNISYNPDKNEKNNSQLETNQLDSDSFMMERLNTDGNNLVKEYHTRSPFKTRSVISIIDDYKKKTSGITITKEKYLIESKNNRNSNLSNAAYANSLSNIRKDSNIVFRNNNNNNNNNKSPLNKSIVKEVIKNSPDKEFNKNVKSPIHLNEKLENKDLTSIKNSEANKIKNKIIDSKNPISKTPTGKTANMFLNFEKFKANKIKENIEDHDLTVNSLSSFNNSCNDNIKETNSSFTFNNLANQTNLFEKNKIKNEGDNDLKDVKDLHNKNNSSYYALKTGVFRDVIKNNLSNNKNIYSVGNLNIFKKIANNKK